MRIAIVYNEPYPSRYDTAGEEKAVLGVLQAVTAVHQSLLELGYDVTRVPLLPPLENTRKKLNSLDTDLVFNLFEGFCDQPESETSIPEALSELGIPFTGCPATALRLGLDKAKVKVMLGAAGIMTPAFQLLGPKTLHTFQLNYPCIVKPRNEDASHGLTEESVVSNFTSLEKQVCAIFDTYNNNVLVEEFLDGREFNVTVLGNSQCDVLPASEIAYSLPVEMPNILTFAAKWEPESLYFQNTKVICPAKIEAEEQEHLNKVALEVFQLLNCRGYARVDMRMNQYGQLNVIEVNPNPDISPDAGAIRQSEAAGMTYTQFVEKIVQLALRGNSNDDQDSSHDSSRQTQHNGNTARSSRVQASRDSGSRGGY